MFKALIAIGAITFALVIFAAGGGVWLFYHYGRDLPDYQQLADWAPAVVDTRNAMAEVRFDTGNIWKA